MGGESVCLAAITANCFQPTKRKKKKKTTALKKLRCTFMALWLATLLVSSIISFDRYCKSTSTPQQRIAQNILLIYVLDLNDFCIVCARDELFVVRSLKLTGLQVELPNRDRHSIDGDGTIFDHPKTACQCCDSKIYMGACVFCVPLLMNQLVSQESKTEKRGNWCASKTTTACIESGAYYLMRYHMKRQ